MNSRFLKMTTKTNTKKTGSQRNITTDWSVILGDNKAAVKDFVAGGSLRTMIMSLNEPAARTEAYKLEKHVGSTAARIRAKKALARISKK